METLELFDRCVTLAAVQQPTADTNRAIHETLVLVCAEGLRHSGQAYGNLFSQIDFLCKRCGISIRDKMAIQTMRRHSNAQVPLSPEDLLYDIRALARFISAVFSTDIPNRLLRLIPVENRPTDPGTTIDTHYVRCIVNRWDDHLIYAETGSGEISIDYTHQEKGTDLAYLKSLLREGMQLNLLDCTIAHSPTELSTRWQPRLVVVEPDFLVDISAIAACFTDYGHHPLLYTVNRLKPRANTQPILLGNFAGNALDDMINNPDFRLNDTIADTFCQQALQFCACETFSPPDFMRDAQQQVNNLREVISLLFEPKAETDRLRNDKPFRKEKVILEPSFVCERLGLQGRVDLMTTDMRLLVEQKSGKNYNIELLLKTANSALHRKSTKGLQLESHYVQLLLYYGVLHYNFGVTDQQADIRLLYSRYPAEKGLLVVNFYQQLFREAIKFRNQLVATEFFFAKNGFARILPLLNPQTVYPENHGDTFFSRYVAPEVTVLGQRLRSLSPLEQAYFTRMMTFVYREQLYAKVGTQEGRSAAISDLWNMPLSEKRETGNIFTGLRLTERQRSRPHGGYDRLSFDVPAQGDNPASFLPNFRRGDMVYVYAYQGEPDVCRNILYKGTLEEIHTDRLAVRLSDGQQNPEIFRDDLTYAIEHGSSDISTGNNILSLCELANALPTRRALLLGQRPPETGGNQPLSRSYHPNYDGILRRAIQAKDYFLLIGPPGTGKTSMALRYLIEELLASGNKSLLLASYTNRAVDEICEMLSAAGFDYIRLGNASSCDPRFRHRLLDATVEAHPRLDEIRRRLVATPIIVGTTSMLQSRPYIFQLKPFDVAIVDEASQILEPNIVGLLSKVGKFILIGDYKQLPAVVQQPERESAVTEPCLRTIGLTDCRHSLFERLIRWEQANHRDEFIGILRKQGRMHPDIAEFPNRMFYVSERLEPVPCPHQLDTSLGYDLPSEDALDEQLKSQRMLFIPAQEGQDMACSDKVNPAEARIVADLLRRIYRFYGHRFDADKTVGVIVPYRNQIAMIRQEVDKLGIPLLAKIAIDTVERYQGSQRDVIIYSFTVRFGYQLDFLTNNCFEEDGHTIDRKLNVAITRARKQMLLTGCEPLLRQNHIFAQLIEFVNASSHF